MTVRPRFGKKGVFRQGGGGSDDQTGKFLGLSTIKFWENSGKMVFSGTDLVPDGSEGGPLLCAEVKELSHELARVVEASSI